MSPLLNRSQAGVAGQTTYKTDDDLSESGIDYAKKMAETLLKYREHEHKEEIRLGGHDREQRPLIIWTSTKRRTFQTASFLQQFGHPVRQRTQMAQLHPGIIDKMSDRRVRERYPEEVAKHEADPYHHRYPRAEVSSKSSCTTRLTFLILVISRSCCKIGASHIGT